MITATIRPDSPRASLWLGVLGTVTVPILSPMPTRGTSPHHPAPGALFYALDVAALTPQQRARLVAATAERFGLSVAQVERDFDDPEHGVPILADDVSVTMTGEHAALLVS